MFLGAGPSELIFILVLAFIIFGPSRMPEVAKSIGKAIGEFKKATQGIQTAVQKDLIQPISTDLLEPVNTIKEGANPLKEEPKEEDKGDTGTA